MGPRCLAVDSGPRPCLARTRPLMILARGRQAAAREPTRDDKVASASNAHTHTPMLAGRASGEEVRGGPWRPHPPVISLHVS